MSYTVLQVYRLCLQDLQRTCQLPTPSELAQMKDDLSFKQNEMEKSEATASGLAGGEYNYFCCMHCNVYNTIQASFGNV